MHRIVGTRPDLFGARILVLVLSMIETHPANGGSNMGDRETVELPHQYLVALYDSQAET